MCDVYVYLKDCIMRLSYEGKGNIEYVLCLCSDSEQRLLQDRRSYNKGLKMDSILIRILML